MTTVEREGLCVNEYDSLGYIFLDGGRVMQHMVTVLVTWPSSGITSLKANDAGPCARNPSHTKTFQKLSPCSISPENSHGDSFVNHAHEKASLVKPEGDPINTYNVIRKWMQPTIGEFLVA